MDGGRGFAASRTGGQVWNEKLAGRGPICSRTLRQTSHSYVVAVSVVSSALVQLSGSIYQEEILDSRGGRDPPLLTAKNGKSVEPDQAIFSRSFRQRREKQISLHPQSALLSQTTEDGPFSPDAVFPQAFSLSFVYFSEGDSSF